VCRTSVWRIRERSKASFEGGKFSTYGAGAIGEFRNFLVAGGGQDEQVGQMVISAAFSNLGSQSGDFSIKGKETKKKNPPRQIRKKNEGELNFTARRGG